MTRTATLFATAFIAAGTMLSALPAHAQRAFVSGSGSDSNACTFAAPCRTFAQAFTTVAAGGEIDVLDPAGYGQLTVTKAVSIQGHGFASITAASGNGITINAGASDAILLNGLLIDGEGTGTIGVSITQAGSVQIVDCVIRHFSNVGIDYAPSNAAILSISNTIASDNGNFGIFIGAQSGTPPVTLDAVTATHNGAGLDVFEGQVMVSDSNLSNNSQDGLKLLSGGLVTVKSSVLANNTNNGVNAGGGTAWLTRSVIYGNGTGVGFSGGTVNSFGDNNFANNGADESGGSLGTATAQ